MDRFKKIIIFTIMITLLLTSISIDVQASSPTGEFQQKIWEIIHTAGTLPTEAETRQYLIDTFGEEVLKNKNGLDLWLTGLFVF